MKKPTTIEQDEAYVEFLRKRVQSENFRQNVSEEEYKKTLAKYIKQSWY